jgi:hypothetical protein
VSVSAPLRRLKGAPALRPAALSSATLVVNWGRRGAAKLRLLTVNNGPSGQKQRSSTAISAVMGPLVRIWHARGQSLKARGVRDQDQASANAVDGVAMSRDELSGGPAKGVCDPLSKG